MPLTPFDIKPGIVKDTTELEVGQNYWTDGNNIRFRLGKPEPVGGHQAEANYTATGTPRYSKSWVSNSGEKITAIGTNSHLMVVVDGTLYDITPLRKTSAGLSNPFTTVAGSASVTVTDTTHEAVAGDYVVISGASAVNGITLDGEYVVASVTDANNYVVTAANTASGSGSGGGTVTVEYLIHTGADIPVLGRGWSAGAWGDEAWGTARTASAVVSEYPALWSLDTWGEDLIACRLDNNIFLWDASVGAGTRAAALTNAPTARFALVSDPDRHVVAYGASGDAMLVAWCSQEANTVWTPTATNTAGDQRLKDGTAIMSAVLSQDNIFITTDKAAYQQYFTGPPYTFGFRTVGTNCGCIAQNALQDIAGVPFWVGFENFYQFTGKAQTISCPVRRYMFDDLNQQNRSKIFTGVNELYQEWWIFYPSANSTECDKFLIFNYAEGHWSIGTLSRTTWEDKDSWVEYPIAFTEDGTQYYHEKGTNADTSALNSYVESGYIDLVQQGTEGERLLRVDKFVPDMEDLVGTVQLTVTTRKYPQAPETVKGPFDVTSSTEKVSLRAKGRQFKIKFQSNELDTDWRLGKLLFNVEASSRR